MNSYHRITVLGDVYLKIKEIPQKTYDLKPLINAVAKKHVVGDGLLLIDTMNGQVYEKNTKKFIVGRARIFIQDLNEWLCTEENMAEFVSVKQMNKLIAALSGKEKKEISCYSFVYIYIIYSLLPEGSTEAKECAEVMEIIKKQITNFYNANPTNQLAAFLTGCFKPIVQAIKTNNKRLSAHQLPAVPRRHICNEQE